MSNKSLFEKLFEEVMQDDAEALGLPSGEEGGETGGGGEDFGGEEQSDEVTFTLDRETAQKLHDVLMAALGGEEEGGEEGEGEEQGGEEFGSGEEGGMGDEAAEEEETEDEDSEEEEEDEEPMKESPQAKYEPFETKGKAATLQKKSNARVQGALANKTSAHGKAEKTAQTQGTAHYMPFNTKYDDAKSSIKVNNPKYAPNGQGDSIFG